MSFRTRSCLSDFLAAIEGIRADVAQIRELLDSKTNPDAAGDSSKRRGRSGVRRTLRYGMITMLWGGEH